MPLGPQQRSPNQLSYPRLIKLLLSFRMSYLFTILWKEHGIYILKTDVTLHLSVPNISIFVLVLSKLNIAMSFQHLPERNS